MGERKRKTLENMSFKQKKKEWNNAKKKLKPENEYLEALTRNLTLKLKHKRLVEQFKNEYDEEIEAVREEQREEKSGGPQNE